MKKSTITNYCNEVKAKNLYELGYFFSHWKWSIPKKMLFLAFTEVNQYYINYPNLYFFSYFRAL